jgi:hypothetical protein
MSTAAGLARSDETPGSTTPLGAAPRPAGSTIPLGAAPRPAAGAARRRAAWGALAAALLAAALFELVKHGTGWWQFLAFGAAPDLALLAGIGSGLATGQLHPRAVPLYNALHRFSGPVAFAIVAAAFLPVGYIVGALAWGLHVAVDRVAGYGLRTPDGFQRA